MRWILFTLLIGCTTDYRTDYERNNGIEPTPEQIEVRKQIEKERLARETREMLDKQQRMRFRNSVLACGVHRSFLECW